MAKRFTDTDKWKRPWFTDLSMEAKLVWFYLLDNCDHAGVWYTNLKLLSFQVGIPVHEDDLLRWFGDKLRNCGDKYHIKSFIEFQYGVLTPTNNAHRGVISTLTKLGIIEPLRSPSQGAQDKDKDQDQDQDQEEESGQAQKPVRKPTTRNAVRLEYSTEFELVWKQYQAGGRARGDKGKSWKLFTQLKLSPPELELLTKAITGYVTLNPDRKFMKHFERFLESDWRIYAESASSGPKFKFYDDEVTL